MAILLSIRPEQLANILNRETTIVILKSQLPLNVPVYLYCKKGKPHLVNFGDYEHPYKAEGKGHETTILNGKVVAKCVFTEVEEIACESLDAGVGYNTIYYTETRDSHEELCDLACLDISDLKFCLGEKDKGQIVGYAYHISNLQIFDPKDISEFYKPRCKHRDTNGVCMIDHHKYACVYEEGDYNPYVTINVLMCCKPKERLSKAPTTWCKIEVE